MNSFLLSKELKSNNSFTLDQLNRLNGITKEIESIKNLSIENSNQLNNSIQLIENQIKRIKNSSIIQEIVSKLEKKQLSSQIISLLLSKLDIIENGYQKFLNVIDSLDISSKEFLYPKSLQKFFQQVSQLRVVKNNSGFSTGIGQITLAIVLSNAKLKPENSIDSGDLMINNKFYDIKSNNSKSAIIKAESQADKSYLNKNLDYIICNSEETRLAFKMIPKEDLEQYLKGFRVSTTSYSGGRKIQINL